jgi:predicted RecA/RadA family phage recombinase
MSTNGIQKGDVLTLIAPAGGVVSGVPVVIGSLFVVPAVTAVETAPFSGDVVGVFELPKLSTAVLAAGTKVSWDATNKRCVVPGTGMIPIGAATEAAGNGTATAKVRLDGVSTAAAT